MWHLYIFMAALCAGVVLKIVHPLMGRGAQNHDDVLTKKDGLWVYVLVGALPTLSLGIYLFLGQPDVPGAPAFITRDRAVLYQRNDDHMSLLAQRPVETLVRENPEDIGALLVLGDINKQLKKHDAAVEYYRQAYLLAKRDKDWRVRLIGQMLGESLVEVNHGVVGKEARGIFDEVITLYPKSPVARFYLILEKDQQGQRAEALQEWMALLNEGEGNPYWKDRIRAKIKERRIAP